MMETVTKQTKQQQQTEREGIVSQLSTPLLVLVLLVLLDRRYTESPVYKMNVAVFSSLAVPNKPYGFCGR